MSQPTTAAAFQPGDRVLRNRDVWRHLWLDDPRAGMDVGEIIAMGWHGPAPMSGPFNAATVRWGDIYRSHELIELLPASARDVDDQDFSDPKVLWATLAEDWERSYGSPITSAFLVKLRHDYEARQALRRRTSGK